MNNQEIGVEMKIEMVEEPKDERHGRHPSYGPADYQRMQETLDALPECPTEEQAEAVLQAWGTSGKEAVNDFIERLLRDRSALVAALNGLKRGYHCWCQTWVGGEHEPECEQAQAALNPKDGD